MDSHDTAGSGLSHLQPANSIGATFVEWFVPITPLRAADMPQTFSIYQKALRSRCWPCHCPTWGLPWLWLWFCSRFNPHCWQGWLCRGVPLLITLPDPSSEHQLVQHWGLEALGGFTTCYLVFTGALFALPWAGEHQQPVPAPAPSSPGDELDPGARRGDTGSGHLFHSMWPREFLTNKLVLQEKNAAACLKLLP